VIWKKELPVRIIAKVGLALQELFGEIAGEAAKRSEVIVRKRKFTAMSLARTFVLGFLRNPQASDEELAQIAAESGVAVTPQAIEQRHTQKLVKFLQELFCKASQMVVGSDKALAPILERFRNVTLLDSSTITLPDSLSEEFPGCGGSYGSGAAAMKLQTEWDFRSGALSHVEIESGRSPDGATVRQEARRGPGSLRISDLGYFNMAVFADMDRHDEYFLSRLQFGTHVVLPGGDPVELLKWLAQQRGLIDQPILLGKEQRLPCRVIACRVPGKQASRRRQKLHREHMRKNGKEPSSERLAWCDWTILVSNVPMEKMSSEEAIVLYRARWQVELLFKRWKSQDLVAVLRGTTTVRQMVRVWSRLLAALVQHWLMIASAWGDPTKSLNKVCEAIRPFAGRLAAGLERRSHLEGVLIDLCAAVAKTCRRNQRSKPGTFELLNDVRLLDFYLT
jgi:Transposase DDE domain